jgi:hypothetical protein
MRMKICADWPRWGYTGWAILRLFRHYKRRLTINQLLLVGPVPEIANTAAVGGVRTLCGKDHANEDEAIFEACT